MGPIITGGGIELPVHIPLSATRGDQVIHVQTMFVPQIRDVALICHSPVGGSTSASTEEPALAVCGATLTATVEDLATASPAMFILPIGRRDQFGRVVPRRRISPSDRVTVGHSEYQWHGAVFWVADLEGETTGQSGHYYTEVLAGSVWHRYDDDNNVVVLATPFCEVDDRALFVCALMFCLVTKAGSPKVESDSPSKRLKTDPSSTSSPDAYTIIDDLIPDSEPAVLEG